MSRHETSKDFFCMPTVVSNYLSYEGSLAIASSTGNARVGPGGPADSVRSGSGFASAGRPCTLFWKLPSPACCPEID